MLQTIDKPETKTGGIAADRLRSLVERIERLEEERKSLGSDIKDIFAEAKSAGFDCAVLRELIRIRRKEPADVEEAEVRVEADTAQGGETILQQERVGKGEQGVDRIARRAAIAALEVEGAARRRLKLAE